MSASARTAATASLQRKEVGFELADIKAGQDGWQFSGHAAVFGNVDLGGDVILPGAFKETLRSGAFRPLLWQHDMREPIGVEKSLVEDEKGLFGTWEIVETARGSDAYKLLKKNALRSMSIGYRPVEMDFDEDIRLLKAVDLIENSLVSVGMNPAALVTAVKAEDAALLPFDALWQRITESLKTGAAEAKALAERRGAEQRKLSDRSLDALRAGMAEAEALLAEVRALIAAQDAAVTPAQAKAAGGLALRLELARRRLKARGLLDEHGEIVP